jgi:hypothetical protein
MGEMLSSRNQPETKNNSNAHFAKPKRNKKQVRCSPRETKRNETKMGEIGLEAPFRFIRFFSVFSVTLTPKHGERVQNHRQKGG